ncbi:MAG: hypothetical protein M0R03_16335 [Novosphingobium sp.]|nr:hypothetical protein [Novosphingobium sp.]
MNKIKWNVEEEKGFLYDAKEYIICKDCGYLVKNPDEILKKCPSCGISYEQSLSVIVNN